MGYCFGIRNKTDRVWISFTNGAIFQTESLAMAEAQLARWNNPEYEVAPFQPEIKLVQFTLCSIHRVPMMTEEDLGPFCPQCKRGDDEGNDSSINEWIADRLNCAKQEWSTDIHLAMLLFAEMDKRAANYSCSGFCLEMGVNNGNRVFWAGLYDKGHDGQYLATADYTSGDFPLFDYAKTAELAICRAVKKILQAPPYKAPETWTSDRRICLTSDRQTAVEENDPRAAIVLVGRGGEILLSDAVRYGLVAENAEVNK